MLMENRIKELYLTIKPKLKVESYSISSFGNLLTLFSPISFNSHFIKFLKEKKNTIIVIHFFAVITNKTLKSVFFHTQFHA